MDLKQHLIRQMVYSKATFGPGDRTEGVLDHMEKEIEEVRNDFLANRLTAFEWADLVLLSLDGLTRSLWANSEYKEPADVIAEMAANFIANKQGKNELRNWPDWRTAEPGKAIEHVRIED